jgi:hypothetical protein
MEPVEGSGRKPLEGRAEKDGRIGPLEVERPADLLEKHRLAGRADGEMDLPTGGEENLEKPHGVGSA